MESLLAIFNKYQSDSGYFSCGFVFQCCAMFHFWICISLRSTEKKRKKSKSVETDITEERDTKKKKSVAKAEPPADEDSDDEEAAEPAPKQSKKKEKKGKDTPKEEQSIESPAAKTSNSSSVDSASKKGASNSSPFQRVKAEDVTYLKVKGGQVEAQRLKDNTFESKVLQLRPRFRRCSCHPPQV
jgi:type IV secretory pathway VirB10-like protein